MGPFPQAGQLQPPQQQQFGQRAGQIGLPQFSQGGGSGQSGFLQQQGFPAAQVSGPVGRVRIVAVTSSFEDTYACSTTAL